MVGSNALVFLATIRVAWQILAPSMGMPESVDESRWVTYMCGAVLIGLVFVVVVAGIFPQSAADAIQAAFGGLGYLK
jgi:cytochrome b561